MANALMFINILAIAMQICVTVAVDCKRHPTRVDPTTCCPIPELISDDIMDKCKVLMISPQSMIGEMAASVDSKIFPLPLDHHDHRSQGCHIPSCFMSCVLNETGIITAKDAKLNEAKLSEYLKVVLNGSTDLIPAVETSFKICSQKADKLYDEMQEQMQDKMKNRPSTNMSQNRMMQSPICSPFVGRLMGCVFLQSFKSCPKTIWSNTKECNEMRDHIRECIPKLDNNNKES